MENLSWTLKNIQSVNELTFYYYDVILLRAREQCERGVFSQLRPNLVPRVSYLPGTRLLRPLAFGFLHVHITRAMLIFR